MTNNPDNLSRAHVCVSTRTCVLLCRANTHELVTDPTVSVWWSPLTLQSPVGSRPSLHWSLQGHRLTGQPLRPRSRDGLCLDVWSRSIFKDPPRHLCPRRRLTRPVCRDLYVGLHLLVSTTLASKLVASPVCFQ